MSAPMWLSLKVGLTTVPIGAAGPNGSTNMGPIHEVGEPSTRAIVWSLCAVPSIACSQIMICFSFLASNNHAFLIFNPSISMESSYIKGTHISHLIEY